MVSYRIFFTLIKLYELYDWWWGDFVQVTWRPRYPAWWWPSTRTRSSQGGGTPRSSPSWAPGRTRWPPCGPFPLCESLPSLAASFVTLTIYCKYMHHNNMEFNFNVAFVTIFVIMQSEINLYYRLHHNLLYSFQIYYLT